MFGIPAWGDQQGTERAWDVVSRTTKSHSRVAAGVDAVIILPLLRSKKQQLVETLLVGGWGDSCDIAIYDGWCHQKWTAQARMARDRSQLPSIKKTDGMADIPILVDFIPHRGLYNPAIDHLHRS